MIEVNGLTKEFKMKQARKGLFRATYSNITAVDHINLKIKKGEIVAFIGPNGAGKSTTIKMLTGIIQPTNGIIKVDGLSPSRDRKELSYKIGCMFGQKSQLYMHLSVLDSFKLLGSIYDLTKEETKERINEIAELFKIQHLLNKTVRKLSLGQRMICEIAGSILHQPDIIFLDEPTIGLDIVAKLRIREIILKLNKEKGTTIFLTSHDVGDVEALCHRIIVINEGKIVTDSSIEELKAKYLSSKIVTIYYDHEMTLQELNYDILEAEDNRIVIHVDTNQTKMGEILSYFSSIGNISDISIDSTPLEDIIKTIYEEKRKI